MTKPLGFSGYIYVVRGAGGLCLALSFLSVCVLLLQVNLCEAAAVSSFICRQAARRKGGSKSEGGTGGEKDGGGEKEGEQ